MTNAVGIRFRQAGKIYTFDSLDFNIDVGESVIVETVRGKELGFCAKRTTPIDTDEIDYTLKPVIRVASEEDKERYRENVIKAVEAFNKCKELIKKHELPMKLTDANYTFDNHKLIFYFTADDRIDFRELVKDLAYVYRTRIELRQIGVRDEAKILGGLGPCGRELCCKNWMSNFSNVTIKMAKDQNIALTPSRISGMCGRLLCCLNYEEAFYEEKISEMPRTHSRVMTPKGAGTVIYTNAITDEITVQLESEDGSFSQEVFKLTDEIYEAKDGGTCSCPMKNVTTIDINAELQNAEEEFGEVVEEDDFTESLEDDELEVESNKKFDSKDKEYQDNKKKFKDNKKRFKDKNKKYHDTNKDGEEKPFKKNYNKDKKDNRENSEKYERKDRKNKPFKKNDNFDRRNNRDTNGNRRSKRLIDREKRARKIENEGDDSF